MRGSFENNFDAGAGTLGAGFVGGAVCIVLLGLMFMFFPIWVPEQNSSGAYPINIEDMLGRYNGYFLKVGESLGVKGGKTDIKFKAEKTFFYFLSGTIKVSCHGRFGDLTVSREVKIKKPGLHSLFTPVDFPDVPGPKVQGPQGSRGRPLIPPVNLDIQIALVADDCFLVLIKTFGSLPDSADGNQII